MLFSNIIVCCIQFRIDFKQLIAAFIRNRRFLQLIVAVIRHRRFLQLIVAVIRNRRFLSLSPILLIIRNRGFLPQIIRMSLGRCIRSVTINLKWFYIRSVTINLKWFFWRLITFDFQWIVWWCKIWRRQVGIEHFCLTWNVDLRLLRKFYLTKHCCLTWISRLFFKLIFFILSWLFSWDLSWMFISSLKYNIDRLWISLNQIGKSFKQRTIC